jgi:hypothetical protein
MRRGSAVWLVLLMGVGKGCSPADGPRSDAARPDVVAPKVDDAGRPVDPSTGLVLADDYELVATHCVACHSAQQFLRQRGTHATWQGIIDWMQATQGLWEFPEGVEERIVGYLATHYGPEGTWRRAPIPADLMPPDAARSQMRAAAETVRAERR